MPAESIDGDVNLDYSSNKPGDIAGAAPTPDLSNLVDENSRGTIGTDGLYEVKDLDFGGKVGGDEDDSDEEEDNVIARALSGTSFSRKPVNNGTDANSTPAAGKTSRFGLFSGLLSRITGGSKVLTKEDLDPVLAGMRDHLMQKNVAQEIATKVCEGLGEGLVGKQVSGFRGECTIVMKPFPSFALFQRVLMGIANFRPCFSTQALRRRSKRHSRTL